MLSFVQNVLFYVLSDDQEWVKKKHTDKNNPGEYFSRPDILFRYFLSFFGKASTNWSMNLELLVARATELDVVRNPIQVLPLWQALTSGNRKDNYIQFYWCTLQPEFIPNLFWFLSGEPRHTRIYYEIVSTSGPLIKGATWQKRLTTLIYSVHQKKQKTLFKQILPLYLIAKSAIADAENNGWSIYCCCWSCGC